MLEGSGVVELWQTGFSLFAKYLGGRFQVLHKRHSWFTETFFTRSSVVAECGQGWLFGTVEVWHGFELDRKSAAKSVDKFLLERKN